jgi:O-antigen ligase
VPLAAFVVLILVALAVSTDRRQSLFGEVLQHQGVLTTLLYVGFFYLARSQIRDLMRMRLLLAAVATGATIVSGYAIVQKLGLDPIWHGWLPSGRVFSTIGQANALGAYLVLAIPVTAALALTSTRRVSRLTALAAVAAMITALVFTASRGGLVGLGLAAAVFTYGVRDRITLPWGSARAYAGTAIVGTVLIVVSILAPARATLTGLWHSTPRSATVVDHDVSVDDHLDLWRVAIEIVEHHPFAGTGPETFPDQFVRYGPEVLPSATVVYFELFRVESPHNQILGLAAGAGIPAVVAYVAVLVGLARTLWRGAKRCSNPATRLGIVAVVAAGAGHLVTDSFMTAEVTGSWLFWTLAGAGIALATIGTAPTEGGASYTSPAATRRRATNVTGQAA